MKLKIQEPENCPGRTYKADINKQVLSQKKKPELFTKSLGNIFIT